MGERLSQIETSNSEGDGMVAIATLTLTVAGLDED